MTWEYKVLPKRTSITSVFNVLNPYTEEELTKLGAQGWEAVLCVFSDESSKIRSALLKRAVSRDAWVVKTEPGTIENGLITPGRTEVIKVEGWKAKLAEMLNALESAESEAAVTGAMQALLDEFPDPSPEQITLSNLLELLSYAVEDADHTKFRKLIAQIRTEVVK